MTCLDARFSPKARSLLRRACQMMAFDIHPLNKEYRVTLKLLLILGIERLSLGFSSTLIGSAQSGVLGDVKVHRCTCFQSPMQQCFPVLKVRHHSQQHATTFSTGNRPVAVSVRPRSRFQGFLECGLQEHPGLCQEIWSRCKTAIPTR